MSADGYDTGSIALDSRGTLWMGWGQTLRNYDPATGVLRSWNLPPYSGLAYLYSTDGRIESLAIDSSGEIWVVASMVTGVLGFNPVTSKWNRTISLHFVPELGTVLAAPAAGMLTLNGATLSSQRARVFARIAISTKIVTMLPADVFDYVVTSPDKIVYLDSAGNLLSLILANGATAVLVPQAPVFRDEYSHFGVDAKGRVWFPMSASLGVGVFDPATGAVGRFQFPQLENPGSLAPIFCPPMNALQCPPTGPSSGVGIAAVFLDQHSNVWIITDAAARDDPISRPIIAAVVELQPPPLAAAFSYVRPAASDN
jgi:hypothetical protein